MHIRVNSKCVSMEACLTTYSADGDKRTSLLHSCSLSTQFRLLHVPTKSLWYEVMHKVYLFVVT
jgi:site-specific recombinase